MQSQLRILKPDRGAPAELGEPRTRILAVDDDERNLMAIAEVLSDAGDVVTARSGEEALRHLLREEFAVILLDVLMPGLDGYETAALIRQREQSRGTPIIFLTAINKEQAHMLRGYDAGAVDFVFKPFDPLILRSKVSVFVDLFEKTREIEHKAAHEQQLLESALRANTEKLEVQRALARSQNREQAILGSLPVCFHARAVTPPFGARYVSPGVERLTGYSPDRLTSDPEFGLARVHPDDHDRVVRALSTARALGFYSCEFRWRCADDNYRIFLDQGVVAADGENGEAEIYGTLLDITERRQLEDRVMQSQRLDAVGKLTGGLAHDFNNLLATILSGIGLLERRAKLGEDAVKVVEMMRHSARQGADLVTRLLAFSRRQHLKPTAVPLTSLADTMNGLVAQVLGGLVKFEWLIDDSAWPAHVDSAQLELALMNLVFNARDAMPDGGTVTIAAENRTLAAPADELAAGDYVVVTVTDTGAGIAKDILTKVVEPFFTTKSVGKGTGLGLSSVYGFATQSGGALKIDSTVGRGTSIAIWLPRSEEAVTAARAAPVPEPATAQFEVQQLSVLLVDDSVNLREMTAQSLGEQGFSVVTAGGGAEALALIERDPRRFDVIVTDYAMPLVSGLDVIRFARTLRANWPAVMITGYAGAIEGRPADVPLLAKPFQIAELSAAIMATAGPARRVVQ